MGDTKTTPTKPIPTDAPATEAPPAPDAGATSGGAKITEPKGGKTTAAHITAALAPFAAIGDKTAAALAKELSSLDFVATDEDAAALQLEAAFITVTGHGRINRDQAINAARSIRAAQS